MKHGAKRNRRRANIRWKTAIPTFLLSIAVFGVAVLLPWLTVKESGTNASQADATHGKDYTVLLLLHDIEDTLTAAVSIRADTRTMQVTVTGYPSQTEVDCGTRLSTLREQYAAEGVAVAQRLKAVAGEQYDGVIRLSISAVAAFVAALGNGVTYTLTEPVGVLDQGQQLLSSLQVADVLRYTAWKQRITGRAAAHAGLVAAIIDRYLVPRCDPEVLFRRFSSVCDDRITVSQFSAISKELERLAAANENGICRVIIPEGRVVGVGTDCRFVLAG